jgi:hypothetical protein
MKKMALGMFLVYCMTGIGHAALIDVGNGTVYDEDTSLYWYQDFNLTADQNYSQMMTTIAGLNASFTSGDWGTWHLASLSEMQGLYQSTTSPNSARTQEIINTFTPIVMAPIFGSGSSWRGIYNATSIFFPSPAHFWSGIFIQDGTTTYTNLNSGNVGAYQLDTASRMATGGWIVASAYNPPAPAVPVPGAIWLLGSGLLAMAGLRKRQK